jgi:hypothetical protein
VAWALGIALRHATLGFGSRTDVRSARHRSLRLAPALALAVAMAAAAALLMPAPPAAADPAGPQPSDYSSTITDVTPGTDVVDLSVVGGDSYLEMRARAGHEVVVLGYSDEPFLRFLPDGRVQENQRSPSAFSSADRYGQVEIPPTADPSATPEWDEVADSGTFAWHDHRIHLMSPDVPTDVERGDEVQRWEVKLLVDDQPVSVHGVLVIEPGVAWWPWLLVAVGLAGAVWVLGRLAPPTPLALGAVAVGCLLAVGVAVAEMLSIPASVGRPVVPVAVPALGLVSAAVALDLVVLARRDGPAVYVLGLAACAAAVGWVAVRVSVFTKPVLPTDLAPTLDRTGTAVAAGLAVGAAVLLVTARQAEIKGGGELP